MVITKWLSTKENKDIQRLFWPILIEQTLTVTIGMVSAMMVSGVGAFAVSGVNLVDTLNAIIIAIFQAIAVGATVIVAQRIGAKNVKDAGETAYQSITFCVLLATIFGVTVMITGRHILSFLYGSADENVLEASATYLFYSAISFPFIGLFAACSGVMRAGGDSRPPMVASAIANVVNVLLAFLLIRMGFGVQGVSIAMLCARVLAGFLAFFYLRKGIRGVILPGGKLRLTKEVLTPVLRVGVPSGIDTAFFQVARVLMTVFMSGMGTVALHANAIGNSVIMFMIIPGSAFSMVSITMVGQAYGAQLFYTVRRFMKKFCICSAVSSAVMFMIVYSLLNPLMSLYSPSPETAEIARRLILILGIMTPFLHGLAFCLPQMLRACGDAKATMYISVCSLILLRMFGSWFFGVFMDWGVVGVWMGMFLDWAGRGISFGIRSFTNAWNGGRKPMDEVKQ